MIPLKNADYLFGLLHDLFKISITYFNQHGEVEYESSLTVSPVINAETLFERMTEIDSHYPILLSTLALDNFIAIPLEETVRKSGVLLIGPSIHTRISEETIQGLKNDLQLTMEDSLLKEYFSALPVISKTDLLNIGKAAYYLLFQKELDILNIVDFHSDKDPTEIENADLLLSANRMDQNFHHPYLLEKEIFRCISEGNKEELFKKIQRMIEKDQLGVLSKRSHVRSQKNLAISGITLATRAAMEGGLEQEVAYTLSDLYIQTLEDAESISQIDRIQSEAFGELADRVKKNKLKKYSKPVNACMNYIFSHLYEEVSLSHLAALTNLSPSYLSKRFKSEVGLPVSLFIQQERIEEAKKLLTFSNYSLSEIYSRLNYNDQSYFTKSFKKVTGLTPVEYRNSTF